MWTCLAEGLANISVSRNVCHDDLFLIVLITCYYLLFFLLLITCYSYLTQWYHWTMHVPKPEYWKSSQISLSVPSPTFFPTKSLQALAFAYLSSLQPHHYQHLGFVLGGLKYLNLLMFVFCLFFFCLCSPLCLKWSSLLPLFTSLSFVSSHSVQHHLLQGIIASQSLVWLGWPFSDLT